MRSIALEYVRLRVATRPESYYTDVVSSGKIINDTHLELTEDAYAALCAKYRGYKDTAVDRSTEKGCC